VGGKSLTAGYATYVFSGANISSHQGRQQGKTREPCQVKNRKPEFMERWTPSDGARVEHVIVEKKRK